MKQEGRARRGPLVWLALASALSAGTAVAEPSKCKLMRLAELPVTVIDSRPIVSAKINGVDASFIADSGAFYSLLSPAAAQQYQLRTTPAPFGFHLSGFGGSAEVGVATVKEFTLAGIPLKHVEFMVGGSDTGNDTVGLIGQNVFHIADVEYDLAHGVIRLVRATDCKHANLAYWTSGTSTPYSVVDINWSSREEPHTLGSATLNGVGIRVMFDTGSQSSFLSRRAAERAGINVEGPDSKPGGEWRGIGRGTIKTWIVPVASFKVGDEEIRNTRLRVGDTTVPGADMTIGADFFLSHHLYVATSQSKLFFTYNGGPVFNLSVRAKAEAPVVAPLANAPSADAPGATAKAGEGPAAAGSGGEARGDAGMPAASPAAAVPGSAAPTTAAEFSRRGTAFASRHDFDKAIADISRACELAPDNPDYFYQRGLVHWEGGQPEAALSDFNRALELKADHVPARVARAELGAARQPPDAAAVLADLEAADRSAAKEADARLLMASLYRQFDKLPESVAELNLWIAAHAVDSRLPEALLQRCWARALSATDLKPALDDCNTAVRRLDKTGDTGAGALDARGLVRLRLGDYDKAIGDFDAALKLKPQSAWTLYARGIAKSRRGKGDAAADLAAASAAEPKIAEGFEARGLKP